MALQPESQPRTRPSLLITGIDYVILGLSGILVYGEYAFATLILSSYLLYFGDVRRGSAVTWAVVTCQTISFVLLQGFDTSLLVYTAQCFSKKSYRKMNLFLRQTCFFSLLIFLISLVSSLIVLPQLQELLGLDSTQISQTRLLIIVSIPAMAIRVVTNNLKNYLRGQGIIQEVGIWINFSFCAFLGYSYIIMAQMRLGFLGFGISLLLHKIATMVSVTTFYYLKTNRKAREHVLPISYKIQNFLREASTASVSLVSTGMLDQLSILIISFSDNFAQISAYGLLVQVSTLSKNLQHGYITVFLKEVNDCLGKKQFKEAKKVFKKRSIHMCLIVAIIGLFSYYFCTIFGGIYSNKSQVDNAIKGSSLSLAISVMARGVTFWMIPLMISFEMKKMLNLCSILFEIVIGVPLCILVVWYLEGGNSGLFLCFGGLQVYALWMGWIVFRRRDFRGFRGYQF